MTKPRARRGCLNQMLIPHLRRGRTCGCSSVPAGSPLLLARGEGAGEVGVPAQHHPPVLAGGQGPAHSPPRTRQGALRRQQE